LQTFSKQRLLLKIKPNYLQVYFLLNYFYYFELFPKSFFYFFKSIQLKSNFFLVFKNYFSFSFLFLFLYNKQLNKYWSVYSSYFFLLKYFFLNKQNIKDLCKVYYSSFFKNQRFFFFLDFNYHKFFLSIGVVLKQLQVSSKGLRSTSRGFLLFLKSSQIILTNIFNSFSSVYTLFFFSGFSKKFFFFINKFISSLFFFNLFTSFFIFLPKISFLPRKLKKYKAIKRVYRKKFLSIESSIAI